MCYANVKLDNLPFLTCRLSLRFGHWLDGSTFNLGFLGVDTFVEGLLWPGSLLRMLTTCGGQRISKFPLFLFLLLLCFVSAEFLFLNFCNVFVPLLGVFFRVL